MEMLSRLTRKQQKSGIVKRRLFSSRCGITVVNLEQRKSIRWSMPTVE
jgi:hypothetical protein